MASVIRCTVISMEHYRIVVDDGNDLNPIDFDLLVQNLEVGSANAYIFPLVLYMFR